MKYFIVVILMFGFFSCGNPLIEPPVNNFKYVITGNCDNFRLLFTDANSNTVILDESIGIPYTYDYYFNVYEKEFVHYIDFTSFDNSANINIKFMFKDLIVEEYNIIGIDNIIIY
jgi:hypothetical protein